MSIREAAYRLCKEIWASPGYGRIHNLMMSLVSVSKEDMDTERDRSWYGFFEQSFGAQFLSYLLIVAQQPEISKRISIPLPPLPPEDLDTLRIAHKALLDLDRLCSAPLVRALPMSTRSVDPYSKYLFELSKYSPSLTVIPNEAAKTMALAFKDHPALQTAIASRAFVESLNSDQYTAAVFQLEKTLSDMGTHKTPDDLVRLIIREDFQAPARVIARHMVSVLSIRASLSVLNQLIFQAFISKKLSALDVDNVIDIQTHSNMLAVGHSVIYQQTDTVRFVRPGELVMLVKVAPNDRDNGLCQVETSSLNYSRDTGTTIDAELRVLDEHLNCYPKLFEHI